MSPFGISDQDERTLALAATAGDEVAPAPPCSVTVPAAGSGPLAGLVKVTSRLNGFVAAVVSIASVRSFWVFFQLAVRVKVVAGSGSGATVMLMFAASAAEAGSTAASVKAVSAEFAEFRGKEQMRRLKRFFTVKLSVTRRQSQQHIA